MILGGIISFGVLVFISMELSRDPLVSSFFY